MMTSWNSDVRHIGFRLSFPLQTIRANIWLKYTERGTRRCYGKRLSTSVNNSSLQKFNKIDWQKKFIGSLDVYKESYSA